MAVYKCSVHDKASQSKSTLIEHANSYNLAKSSSDKFDYVYSVSNSTKSATSGTMVVGDGFLNSVQITERKAANAPRFRPTSSPTIGVYQDALTAQRNIDSANAVDFNTAIQDATPVNVAPPASPVRDTNTNPRPAAPVDNRTQAEKDAAFYAAYNAAIDKAIAGDPTDMKNLDRLSFGAERPPIGYDPEYLRLERRAKAAGVSIDQQKANETAMAAGQPQDPRNVEVNALSIPQEMKTKIIAENLAIQAGARESDSVGNLVNWFNAGAPPDPRTVAFTASSPQNKINVVNATNISQKAKVDVITEILRGNTDSVEGMVTYHGVHGLGMSPEAANWASSATPENQIAVVNAANISQDFKNKVIAEIQAGSNTSDTVYDKISWIERGNPLSAAALAILNPPAPIPVEAPLPSAGTPLVEAAPTVEASAPAPPEAAPTVDASAPAPPSPDVDVEAEATSVTNPESEGVLASDMGHSEEHRKNEEAHAKAVAAQAQADEKKEQALAVATANKKSAKEERMRKINEMRRPWMGGAASSSSGADAMVVPPITPASQVPPPPFQ